MFEKEKKNLLGLLQTAKGYESYNEQDFELISDVYREFSLIIGKLFKAKPNVFGNLRKYSLAEIKSHRRSIDKVGLMSVKEENYQLFYESLVQTIESTIEYIENYV